MNELQASLLEAINTVSRGNDNNNVQTVTIEVEIVSVEDLAKGVYKAKYQSSTMTVYSTGAVYNVGQHVYIIVPNGDFSKNKVILGPSGGLDIVSSDEDKVIEGEVEYIEATQNLLDLVNTEAYICSYEHSTYESMMRSSDSFKAATQKYKKFKLSCDIQTKLPAEQQKAMGEYGFKIRYKTTVGYFEVKIDTSNILGNPYSLTQWSHQYVTFDFPDNAELDLSEAPVCMWYTGGTFYQKEDQPADIFFKNMQLTALMELPIVSGYYLYLVPDNGLTFTDTIKEINIKPDLRLDGVSVNLSQKSAQCYWFVQDNSVLSADDAGYLPLMGARWRCINKKNDEDVFVSDANYTLNIKSDDVFTTEKYSCLIVYDDITYRQEIVIEQFNSSIHFEIKADAEHYIAGAGKVTLNALSDYTPGTAEIISYSWARYDKNGNYIDSNWWETSNNLDSTIVFPTSIIDVKNTFSCSLISNKYNKPLATATYEIVVEESPTIRLVTYNTNVLYKYDANGVSPFHPSYGGSLGKSYATINPIIFKIFKADGNELTEAEYAECQFSWEVPVNTMLDIDRQYLNEEETKYIIPNRNFEYNIRSYYSASRNDNVVSLKVIFDGMTYEDQFEIQFIKDGANGTNGTDYVASIVFEGKDRIIIQGVERASQTPYVIKADGSSQYIKSTNDYSLQLDTVVYNLGREVEESYTVIWEMLEPNKTLFKIDKNNGILTYKQDTDVITAKGAMNYDDSNINIIRATIRINNSIIYAYRVIEYIFFYNPPNVKNFSIDNGPFEVLFNSDGSRGEMKAASPFIAMYDDRNGNRVIDTSVSNNSWTIGTGFSLFADEDSGVSQRYLKILDSLKDKVHTILYASGNHSVDYWKYYRPILLRKNTYGMSDLNSWDGTRLYLDEDGNYMYAAQVGAGFKDNQNRFTGVIMGTNNAGSQGLFGFDKGEQSFLLNALNGSAIFGKENGSQIIIDPSSNKALIKSGNYNTTTDPGGMQIDLSTPEIRFGTGNFIVNSNGHLTAKGGGSIAGWIISDEMLQSANKKITLNASGDGSIYTGNKSTLHTDVDGIYLGPDGIAIGKQVSYSNGERHSKFGVHDDGQFFAQDAWIEGSIYASEGKIGKWKIIDGLIVATDNNDTIKITLDAENNSIYSNNKFSPLSISDGFYLGKGGLAIGPPSNTDPFHSKFHVQSNGIFYAEGCTIRGDIYVEKGSIGRWEISTESDTKASLYANSTNEYYSKTFDYTSIGSAYMQAPGTYIDKDGNLKYNWVYSVQHSRIIDGQVGTSALWRVDSDGNMMTEGQATFYGDVQFFKPITSNVDFHGQYIFIDNILMIGNGSFWDGYSLNCHGGAYIDGASYISGNTAIDGSLSVSKDSTISGKLQLQNESGLSRYAITSIDNRDGATDDAIVLQINDDVILIRKNGTTIGRIAYTI